MVKVRFFEKNGSVWLDFRHAGKRYRRPSGEKSEADARKVAPLIVEQTLERDREVSQPTRPKRSSPTMREAFEKACEVRESWITSKNRKTIEQTFGALVNWTPGLSEDTPVSALTRDRVLEFRSAWLKEAGRRIGTTLAPGTINHRLSMLTTLLRACDLPPHGVKHLSVKGNRRMRRISDAELSEMQEWCRRNAHRVGASDLSALIVLAMETGARQGELLGLQWTDCGDGSVTFRKTKNFESRTIPLTPLAQDVLTKRRDLSCPFPVITKHRVKDLWTRMRADMGLEADTEFVFHTLRHEALSRLADRGANAFVLQAIAGHANITTTQVYVKANLQAMRAAMGFQVGAGGADRGALTAEVLNPAARPALQVIDGAGNQS